MKANSFRLLVGVALFMLLGLSLLWYRSSSTVLASSTSVPTSYSDIEGTWTSVSCSPITNAAGQVVGHSKLTFVFSSETARSWSVTFTFFNDANCRTKVFTLLNIGSYSLDGPSTKVAGATNAFFGFSVKYLTADTSAIAGAFTKAKCGSGTWSVGVAQNVTATGCSPIALESTAACIQEYDLVKLDRNTNRLYLGKRPAPGSNICAPQRRPTQLGFPLKKVQ